VHQSLPLVGVCAGPTAVIERLPSGADGVVDVLGGSRSELGDRLRESWILVEQYRSAAGRLRTADHLAWRRCCEKRSRPLPDAVAV
jgi:hypothetical protein